MAADDQEHRWVEVTARPTPVGEGRIRSLRRLDQADLSNSVVHFTGRRGKANTDVPAEIGDLDARRRLANILITKRIYAFSTFYSCGDPVVCFTEATLEGMRTLVGDRYEPWGLEFAKDQVFQRGGGPALYVRGDLWTSFAQSDLPTSLKAFGTPYWPGVDWPPTPPGTLYVKSILDTSTQWVHEREWRIPVNASLDALAGAPSTKVCRCGCAVGILEAVPCVGADTWSTYGP